MTLSANQLTVRHDGDGGGRTLRRQRNGKRSRLRLTFLLATLGLAVQSMVGAPVVNASATYSQTVTLPVPPALSFAGNSGGDGWDVSLSADRAYNVFHHDILQLACLNQVDATPCWAPQQIVDETGREFYASNHSGADLDQDTGLIHTYAAREDGVGGVLCLDPTAPDQEPAENPYCGFTALTDAGEAQVTPDGPGSPMLVGDRYYAYNFSTGAQNKLLCYDFDTAEACLGQPYAIDFDGQLPDVTRSAHVVIGGKLLIPNGGFNGGATRVACFDPATSTECAGSWPVTIVDTTDFYLAGPPVPVLDSSGGVVGACMPGALTCFAMDGSSITAPDGFPADMGGHYYTGGAVIVAARVLTPGYSPDRVDCYDYSTSAVCAGFPKPLSNASLPYTINTDPYRPTCVWVNSDFGSSQIQAFDAFDGGACGQGAIRVLVSQFVVDEAECYPTDYQSLELLAPASSTYTSASVELLNTNGNPTGISDQTFDASGVVDLTGLGLESEPTLPQFLVTLTDGPAVLGQVSVRLNWNADYNTACNGPDTEVDSTTTSVSPMITSGGVTGTDVTVLEGESATASATLAGENAGGASGSVTYAWYSDATCTTNASQGIVQTITAAGALPDSESVNLPNGTYYVVASYGGDAGNVASASACGDAVLTVGSLNGAPEVTADAASVTTPEGTDAVMTGTVSDLDGDVVTLSADVPGLIDNLDGTWTWSAPAPDGPAGPYTVTVTADDGNGETDSTSFDVSVTNVAPSVNAGPDQSITFGAVVSPTADFGDPGADADWTVDIDWGDSTVQSSTTDATGAITDSHQFLSLGTHTVAICVTDKDGATGCDTMTVTVSNTLGKVTGGVATTDGTGDVSTIQGNGKGGFNVQNTAGEINGNLQFRDDTTNFHALVMTAMAVSDDETSAWFAGVGKDGRTFVAYVEDNGEPGVNDIFQVWIDGVLHGGAGNMVGGNIKIH